MQLIVITNPQSFATEAGILISLFEQGLEFLHLRKPGAPLQEVESLLTLIPSRYHSRISLHSHWALAGKYKVGGLHGPLESVQGASPELWRSHSCHSLAEVEEAGGDYDYVFLSPVFNSISKKGYDSAFPMDTLRQFLFARRQKGAQARVAALGGVDEGNLKAVADLGFDGAAMLGALWQGGTGPQVVDKFNRIKSQCLALNP